MVSGSARRPASLLSALALLVLSLTGCASTLRPVLTPVEPGTYYVLASSTQLVRFDFFPAQDGQMHLVKTTQFLDASDEDPEATDLERLFLFVRKDTGIITYCPDFPDDLGEPVRAFLPAIPAPGQSIPLGATGSSLVEGATRFVCERRGEKEVLGRTIPVITLTANVGGREDRLDYSEQHGIIVAATFDGPRGKTKFELKETNLTLRAVGEFNQP